MTRFLLSLFVRNLIEILLNVCVSIFKSELCFSLSDYQPQLKNLVVMLFNPYLRKEDRVTFLSECNELYWNVKSAHFSFRDAMNSAPAHPKLILANETYFKASKFFNASPGFNEKFIWQTQSTLKTPKIYSKPAVLLILLVCENIEIKNLSHVTVLTILLSPGLEHYPHTIKGAELDWHH